MGDDGVAGRKKVVIFAAFGLLVERMAPLLRLWFYPSWPLPGRSLGSMNMDGILPCCPSWLSMVCSLKPVSPLLGADEASYLGAVLGLRRLPMRPIP